MRSRAVERMAGAQKDDHGSDDRATAFGGRCGNRNEATMIPKFATLLALSICAIAHAQTYPDRPVRIVVPYAAGGATDAVARVVGLRMSQELGQPVIIENKPGADGNIGAEYVARAPNDGYTVLMGDVGNLTMGPAV